MSQYPRLFGTTRIPGHDSDRLVTNSLAKSIVVIRKGRIFHFDVLDENGSPASEPQILSNVRKILTDNRPAESLPIGALTTMDRDSWAELRKELCKSTHNKALLGSIDGALFAVCLDEEGFLDNVQTHRYYSLGIKPDNSSSETEEIVGLTNHSQ